MASSTVTGGVTVTAATLEPLVSWGLSGFPTPVPDVIPGLIAALVITAGHAAYNLFTTWKEKKDEAATVSTLVPGAPVAPTAESGAVPPAPVGGILNADGTPRV